MSSAPVLNVLRRLKTELAEQFSVRNAVTPGDRCYSLLVALTLPIGIGLVVGWRVQKRQDNRIDAEVVHISQGRRNLVSRQLVNQLMKFLFPTVKIAIHTVRVLGACVFILRHAARDL